MMLGYSSSAEREELARAAGREQRRRAALRRAPDRGAVGPRRELAVGAEIGDRERQQPAADLRLQLLRVEMRGVPWCCADGVSTESGLLLALETRRFYHSCMTTSTLSAAQSREDRRLESIGNAEQCAGFARETVESGGRDPRLQNGVW